MKNYMNASSDKNSVSSLIQQIWTKGCQRKNPVKENANPICSRHQEKQLHGAATKENYNLQHMG